MGCRWLAEMTPQDWAVVFREFKPSTEKNTATPFTRHDDPPDAVESDCAATRIESRSGVKNPKVTRPIHAALATIRECQRPPTKGESAYRLPTHGIE